MHNIFRKLFVFLIFLTVPLYVIDDFRLWIGPISIPINLLVLAVFMMILIAAYLIGPMRISIDKDVKFFIGLMFLFTIYHLFSFVFSQNTDLAVKYISRVLGSLLIFISGYLFASKLIPDEQKLYRFLNIAIVSSTVVLLIYIYRYAFIFHSSFLGQELFAGSESGKNQIQIYLIIFLPIIYYVFLKTKSKISTIGLLVHFIAAIYVSSRGLWVSFLIVIAMYALKCIFRFVATMKVSISSLKRGLSIGLMVLVSILIFTTFFKSIGINLDYLYRESISIGTLQDVAGGTSISMRKESLLTSLNYFSGHPLFGIGLGDFEYYNSSSTHNDYAFLLSDTGIVGFLVLMVIIGYSFHLFYVRKLPLYLILPFYVNLLFVNGYTFPFFWLICGIMLGYKRLSKRVESQEL